MRKIFFCGLFCLTCIGTHHIFAYDVFSPQKISTSAALIDFKKNMDSINAPRSPEAREQDLAQTHVLLTLAADDDNNVSAQQLDFIKKAYRSFLQTLYPEYFRTRRISFFPNKNLEKIMRMYSQSQTIRTSLAPSKPKFAEERSSTQPHSRRRDR